MSPNQLISFHIIDPDVFGQPLVTWSYPRITEEERGAILRRAKAAKERSAVFFRMKSGWIYMMGGAEGGGKRFTLAIVALDYDPGKYDQIGGAMYGCFKKTQNPVDLVQIFLTAFKGAWPLQENGTAVDRGLEEEKKETILKELIIHFGMESILIYTSLLLKKRLAIYHSSVVQLLKFARAIVTLMPQRKVEEHFYPWIENTQQDLNALRGQTFYFIGFTDSSLTSRTDLFDVFIDSPAAEITVLPPAKASLTMTKTHKEIALFMTQLAANAALGDRQVRVELAKKTDALIGRLKTLAVTQTSDGAHMVSVESLKSLQLSAANENFLFQLALAENMMML